MYQGGNQAFASPEEALAHISEQTWSSWTKADYTLEQWHVACLIHTHDGASTSKSQCKLPVKTPDGVLNRNGVHAAAAALAGARGGLKGVSADQKDKAAAALKRYYAQLNETPPDSLSHHGVKGQKWGVRKEEDLVGPTAAAKVPTKLLQPGTPEFQQRIQRITRTDRPQVLGAQRIDSGKIAKLPPSEEKQGLSRNQKIALGVGAAGLAAAGYVAYRHYTGSTMPGLDPAKIRQEEQQLAGLKLPAKWDVSGLKDHPLSTQKLGDLAGGEFGVKLKDVDNLVINTSRGYADILPKDGLNHVFAQKQHDSVVRVLEQMRDTYPSIRNMNIEVVPMSRVPGLERGDAHMCVMSMRAGEARVMYNDLMKEPTAAVIRANSRFLPGLGKKDYVAYHEMGHLLAAAHGELPPAFDLASGNASPSLWKTWQKADPLLHKQMFRKHGFTFEELSKLSKYAATEPAEAMAELFGHFSQPEMRQRLTPDQITRATAMFNEMGGLTG